MVAKAAESLAKRVCAGARDFGTPEEFAEAVVACSPNGYEDGVELANMMARRSFCEVNSETSAEMDAWATHSADAERSAVEAWVAATQPTPPFEGIARVATSGFKPVVGYAYRTSERDGTACCLVVSDDTPRPVTETSIVRWEDLREVSPPTEADVALDAARVAKEVEWKAEAERGRYLHKLASETEAATREASKAMAGDPAASIVARLKAATETMAAEVAAGRTVALAGAWAEASAALALLRKAAERELKAAWPSAVGSDDDVG